MTTRTCERCKGTGVSCLGNTCRLCGGTGKIDPPDVEAITKAITTSRGASKGKRRFRASKPKEGGPRAYYVWRMARFHGGADVSMPVCAMMDIEGDPFEPELDALASEVAKVVFGTDKAAAYRWANALGHDLSVPDGMPASAYPGGPVHDGLADVLEG